MNRDLFSNWFSMPRITSNLSRRLFIKSTLATGITFSTSCSRNLSEPNNNNAQANKQDKQDENDIKFSEQTLKARLRLIATNNYSAPDQNDLEQLIPAMVKHIGSPDSELRDDLIYRIFATWIPNQVLSKERLRALLTTVTDKDHLFYHIGEQETDSVFTRTFSMLIIPLVLIVHRQSAFLTSSEVKEINSTVIKYLHDENDLRGYVKERGWAHGVAHAADALDELAQCNELEQNDLQNILLVIREKVSVQKAAYIHNEDERMVTAVISVLRRKVITETEMKQWVNNFAESSGKYPGPENYQSKNRKLFLRSLFFRLRKVKIAENICPSIEQTLNSIR
ncbi:MAG: DUF2785 domain-containing protein [Acidobacteriota bacterium]